MSHLNAPDYLDIPDYAYDQNYFDSISGGGDAIYSELVIIEPAATGKTEIIADLPQATQSQKHTSPDLKTAEQIALDEQLETIKRLFPELSDAELKAVEQNFKTSDYKAPELKTSEQIALDEQLETIKRLFPELSDAELKAAEQNLKSGDYKAPAFKIPDINELFKPKPAPHYPAKNYLTPAAASAQIQTLSDDFFKNLSGNVAIKASAGSGKTRAVINSLSKISIEGQVHVFVPTHDLANEWQENLNQFAPHLKTLHLYGRGGSDSTDHFCHPERYAKVKAVSEKNCQYSPPCANRTILNVLFLVNVAISINSTKMTILSSCPILI